MYCVCFAITLFFFCISGLNYNMFDISLSMPSYNEHWKQNYTITKLANMRLSYHPKQKQHTKSKEYLFVPHFFSFSSVGNINNLSFMSLQLIVFLCANDDDVYATK